MESKLKALKVVELKDILTKAGLSIPTKANKPDLIAKIISEPSALAVFERTHGTGGAAKGSITPAGANTPKPTTTVPAASSVTSAKDDFLSPEVLDWTEDTGSAAKLTAKASSASTKTASKPKPVAVATPASQTPSTTPAQPVAAKSNETKAPTANDAVDEEEEKRRKRAERFGIPVVEPKKAAPPRQQSAKQQVQKAVAVNGKSAGAKAPAVADLDPEMLKKRAERFGLKENGSAEATNPVVGQKRSAPPAEEVDAEELERRRKRAERFGLPVKA